MGRCVVQLTFLVAILWPSGIGPRAAEGHPKRDLLASPQIILSTVARHDTRYAAELAGGGMAELTLVPEVQETVEQSLTASGAAFGAAVVVSVADGRVLALAGRSTVRPALGAELALHPWAPAASIFKVVSAAALLAQARVSPADRVCYHGGLSAVLPENLLDLPSRDTRCDTLAFAVGKSQNAIIAKLASRRLTPEGLAEIAGAFGFGRALPFAAATTPSQARVPEDPVEFARTAAGFWHTSLSPLHGAMLAAAIAADGVMPAPRLIEAAVDGRGRMLDASVPAPRRVIDAGAARGVARMMILTTQMGTARSAFHDRHGRPLLGMTVAGKTGTLNYRGAASDPSLPGGWKPRDGYLGYSWFVGFAPAEAPRVAFAVLLGNAAGQRHRAAGVAQRILAEALPSRRAADGVLAAR